MKKFAIAPKRSTSDAVPIIRTSIVPSKNIMLEASRRQGSSRVELWSKSQPSLKLLCLLDPSDKVKESEHHCQIYRPKPEISAGISILNFA